ncbi:phosphoribosyltransferase [Leifsonia kafniensis]|uniref:Phosphoribosyltransferase n=1 Tax=Leifsonia kafniensis TaxID=475957 RepID=A0ABP7K541_9MICO
MFSDRREAGRRLATRLAALHLDDPIVLALPRGGVPVALEVARALEAPFDLLIVRKIGAPGFPEVALGAVADAADLPGGMTSDGEALDGAGRDGADAPTVVNLDVFRSTGSDARGLDAARTRELAEIDRRRRRYRGDRPALPVRGRVVIVVDDGVATGATAKAAVALLRREGAAEIVLAVPVAPADQVAEMGEVADRFVVVKAPRVFWAIGEFYSDFHQLSDEETLALLAEAWGDGAEHPLGDRAHPGD